MSSSASGRARSDPTHQHRSHLHVHSHSAHHGHGVQYTTMECESPLSGQSRSQPPNYQQASWSEQRDQSGRHISHHHQTSRLSPPPLSGAPSSHVPRTVPEQTVSYTEGYIPGAYPVDFRQNPAASIDSSQLPSVNMHVPGYPAQFGQYPQQAWTAGGFPFSLSSSANSSLTGHETNNQHVRTAAERGDDSPMVGVCVQQSPVASH